MELREALDQIASIRQQVARTEVFRGYRALPTAFSGLLAIAAALVQMLWLPQAAQHFAAFLALWLGVAFLSVVATAWEMGWRLHRSSSALEREKTIHAVSQFSPSLMAGALLLLVLLRFWCAVVTGDPGPLSRSASRIRRGCPSHVVVAA